MPTVTYKYDVSRDGRTLFRPDIPVPEDRTFTVGQTLKARTFVVKASHGAITELPRIPRGVRKLVKRILLSHETRFTITAITPGGHLTLDADMPIYASDSGLRTIQLPAHLLTSRGVEAKPKVTPPVSLRGEVLQPKGSDTLMTVHLIEKLFFPPASHEALRKLGWDPTEPMRVNATSIRGEFGVDHPAFPEHRFPASGQFEVLDDPEPYYLVRTLSEPNGLDHSAFDEALICRMPGEQDKVCFLKGWPSVGGTYLVVDLKGNKFEVPVGYLHSLNDLAKECGIELNSQREVIARKAFQEGYDACILDNKGVSIQEADYRAAEELMIKMLNKKA